MTGAAMPPHPPATVDQIVDALYRAAVDPEVWDDLVDLLPVDEDLESSGGSAQRDLARGVEIAQRLAARERLEPPRTDAAMIDFGPALRVAAATMQAHETLAMGLGRAIVGKALIFEDPENDEILSQAASRVRAENAPSVVRFSTEDGGRPMFGYLAPRLEDGAAPGGLRLVFANAASLVGDLHLGLGLTAAEGRIANQFRLSGSLQDAADGLGISINTARNQLASVFAKLGISRQGDLIRILTELAVLGSALAPNRPAMKALTPAPQSLALPDGRRLSYREYGDPRGNALLAFHEGLGSSLAPPETDRLARRLGLRLVIADRPGYGGSDRDPEYSFYSVAKDMEALCDHLGLGDLSVMGLMSGAPPAVQTAIRLGSRVRRLFLCSGRPPSPASTDSLNPLVLFRARLEANSWFTETLFGLLRTRISPNLVGRGLRRAAARSPGDRAYLDAEPGMAALISSFMTEALAGGGQGPADDLRAFRRAGNLSLDGLHAPLSIWHGEEDTLSPLKDLAAFVGDWPHDLRVIPGIGQFMVLKHWEELLRAAV